MTDPVCPSKNEFEIGATRRFGDLEFGNANFSTRVELATEDR